MSTSRKYTVKGRKISKRIRSEKVKKKKAEKRVMTAAIMNCP